jgi:hypothetical protein
MSGAKIGVMMQKLEFDEKTTLRCKMYSVIFVLKCNNIGINPITPQESDAICT